MVVDGRAGLIENFAHRRDAVHLQVGGIIGVHGGKLAKKARTPFPAHERFREFVASTPLH